MTRIRQFLGLGTLLLATACGARQSSASDPIVAATQRLQGVWKVTTFTPESSLEPPLKSLLDAQLGALTVTFEGSRYSATGPGITLAGHFKVFTAGLDQLSGTLYDSSGLGYRVSGRFEGMLFHFRADDDPFRGEGTLERTQD